MTDGLVLVDDDGRVFHLNRSAQEMLELGSRHVLGTRVTAWLRHPELHAFWDSASREEVPVTADLGLPGGKTVRATVATCLSAARQSLGKILILRDITLEKKIKIELTDELARRLVEIAGQESSTEDLPPITNRENEILRLLVEGLSNAEIAQRLNVSLNTVASHLKNLYPKLNVSSRAQAAAYAVAHGIRPQQARS